MNKCFTPVRSSPTILLLALLLSACASQNNYQRPATPVAETWSGNVNGIRDAQQTSWRAYYPDPRLQALIESALEHNRDLRIATMRVQEARGQYGVQGESNLPTVMLNGGYNASHTSASVSDMGRAMDTRRYDVSVGTVGYELDFWGRIKSLTDASKAEFLASEFAQQSFRLSLIYDVSNAYLSWLELQERAQLAKQTLQTREKTRDLTALRRKVGVAGDLDILAVEGAYQAALAERANLQRQVAAAENFLTVLTGQTPAQLAQLPPGKPLAEQGIVPDLIAGLPSEVLLQRPDVQAAEQKLIASYANIEAIRTAFLPKIALTTSIGTASQALSGLFAGGSGTWAFQPLLSLPLFTGKREAAALDVATARKEIAVAEYEKTLQQAFREVADLLVAREKLAEQLKAQQTLANNQQQKLSLVESRYKAEIASYLELLDAQREAYSAQQNLLQVQRSYLASAGQLYKALAGGSR